VEYSKLPYTAQTVIWDMNIMVSKKQRNPRAPTEITFYIVGPRRIQNEAIASYLVNNTGNDCEVFENISQIPSGNSNPTAQKNLIMCDCLGKDLKRQLTELKTYINHNKSKSRVVFFNVSKEMEFRKKFILKGIHGFFYKHDSLNIFLKGVQAVLDGKLWLSREMMTKCIFEDTDNDKSSKNISDVLTERQIEILAMIAIGATNDEIADKLCISPHTVKTHLYKIFKKINVPNRVQAALWAAKNL
jgi:LuxR family transcriptional regulator, positive regulator of biofilm formation